MNLKNVLIGTVAGAVVMLGLGYLIYDLLLSDMMTHDASLPKADILMIFIGNLFGAGLVTYIFDKWAGIKTFATGATAGLVIGLLMALYMNFIMIGTTSLLDLQTALVNAVASGVMFAITGGVIGLVLGKL